MNAVKCPECGEGFDEKEFHWVTNAEGGVMYRLPCDHMVVGTWKEGSLTYSLEHGGKGEGQPAHEDHHHHFMDDVARILGEKLHKK